MEVAAKMSILEQRLFHAGLGWGQGMMGQGSSELSNLFRCGSLWWCNLIHDAAATKPPNHIKVK